MAPGGRVLRVPGRRRPDAPPGCGAQPGRAPRAGRCRRARLLHARARSCTRRRSGRRSCGSSPVARWCSWRGPSIPCGCGSTVAAEGVNMMTIVGDAVAKPLLDAWDAAAPDHWDVSSLYAISNGGAPLSAGCKARILERFPNVFVTDGFGSSEAGIQGSSRVVAAEAPEAGRHGALRQGHEAPPRARRRRSSRGAGLGRRGAHRHRRPAAHRLPQGPREDSGQRSSRSTASAGS